MENGRFKMFTRSPTSFHVILYVRDCITNFNCIHLRGIRSPLLRILLKKPWFYSSKKSKICWRIEIFEMRFYRPLPIFFVFKCTPQHQTSYVHLNVQPSDKLIFNLMVHRSNCCNMPRTLTLIIYVGPFVCRELTFIALYWVFMIQISVGLNEVVIKN